ncbi:MAG: coenzyme F420-0:L-glutamate ligase, partial [Candidatus Heimdallarchaeota archaeon]|nr:coenzyme F420-0:L-glutamate ligase [Candidatus Heimdallarchaeota archaeon]
MELIPINTPLVSTNDDMFEVIFNALTAAKVKLQDGDVLTIATKIISVTQGLLINKDEIEVSDKAREYAKVTQLSPEFMEVAIRQSDEVLGACIGALLTR